MQINLDGENQFTPRSDGLQWRMNDRVSDNTIRNYIDSNLLKRSEPRPSFSPVPMLQALGIL